MNKENFQAIINLRGEDFTIFSIWKSEGEDLLNMQVNVNINGEDLVVLFESIDLNDLKEDSTISMDFRVFKHDNSIDELSFEEISSLLNGIDYIDNLASKVMSLLLKTATDSIISESNNDD